MAPFIKDPKLTLIRKPGGKVVVDVTYTAMFFHFDRQLVKLGLHFTERIEVIGVDPTGTTLLHQFFPDIIPVTEPVPGDEDKQEFFRHRFDIVDRIKLDEDSSPVLGPDAIPDEIRCRILIDPVDLPPKPTEALTNQVVLGGVINQASSAEGSQ